MSGFSFLIISLIFLKFLIFTKYWIIFLFKLSELNITVKEPPITDLFSKMTLFVKNGEKTEINIPYPKTNQIIEGVLHPKIGKRTWIRMVTPK